VSIRGFFAKTFKNLTNPKHLGWMSFCKSLKTSQLQNLFVISNPPEKQTQVLSIILHLAMSRGAKSVMTPGVPDIQQTVIADA